MSGPEELRALVEKMRAGLEGVTPGPWYPLSPIGSESYSGGCVGTQDSYQHPDFKGIADIRGYSSGFSYETAKLHREHLARCSPENIAKLLDAAESSLASPAGMEGWTVPDGCLNIGRQVVKRTGYPFPGEVRAVFKNKAGLVRYVVEATGPDYAGMLHIFSPEQLSAAPRGDSE